MKVKISWRSHVQIPATVHRWIKSVFAHMSKASSSGSLRQEDEDIDSDPPTTSDRGSEFLERAKFLPLRLSADDRRLLRLLEAALSVSEYTDKVQNCSKTWEAGARRLEISQLLVMRTGMCARLLAGQYLVIPENALQAAVLA